MEEFDDCVKKAYENLAIAIIASAADDYREAMKKGDIHKMKDIEKWFHSDVFIGMAPDGVTGDYILEKLRKEQGYGCNKRK